MVGETVGSYRLLEKIGSGGMGVVWLAEHVTLGRRAAVKMVRADLSADEDLTRRFFTEARAVARLEHPGVVSVLDYGTHTDGSAYLVMELLSGEPLSRRIRRSGRFTAAEVIGIARQVASTLAAVHGAGVIHRDLKPDNIFLVPDPDLPLGVRVKLLDFGIAKLAESSAHTASGAFLGTPAYMAPEQCRGAAKVDARADLYSLGCVMFEMACGRTPFAGPVAAVIGSKLHDDAPSARELVPDLPLELDAVIADLLARDPDDRPTAMGTVLTALGGEPPPRAPPRVEPFAKRRGKLWLVGAGALVLAGIGAVVAGVAQKGPPHFAARPPPSPRGDEVEYGRGGIHFFYSPDGDVATETTKTATFVSVKFRSPVALLLISRFDAALWKDDGDEKALDAYRKDPKSREIGPVVRVIDGKRRSGHRFEKDGASTEVYLVKYDDFGLMVLIEEPRGAEAELDGRLGLILETLSFG